MVTGNLQSIPGVLEYKGRDTLDRVPIRCSAQSLTYTQAHTQGLSVYQPANICIELRKKPE